SHAAQHAVRGQHAMPRRHGLLRDETPEHERRIAMPCCRVARTFAGRIGVPQPFRLFRYVVSATFLVRIRCRAQGCMQRSAAESASGLRMTRDEGPPKDELLDRKPPSLDEVTRYREQSGVQSDSARDSESPPSLPSKRRAQGTNGAGQDDCTKSEAWLDAF